MNEYTFLNLSPYEFEILTRDLLQKELNIQLESYKSGQDQGIDLRYAKNRKSTIVIQCKRYSEFKQLFYNLKKEKEKIERINPHRYIICTSVPLSPKNKDMIIEVFDPFIQNSGDIYGKEDLNNLLGKYSDVEKRHFKLWIGNTNVLQNIIQSNIINQSDFELSEIEETVKYYVQNKSFYTALKALTENSFVIISGEPGVGKTTLARVLTYHFLSRGFEEFIYLSESIKEGFKLFNALKAQIFLFDDFLGRNFMINKLPTNEEKQILKFIRSIKKSKNKLLIFTSREYILQQAKSIYDLFETPQFNASKCIINLSSYSVVVKSKILYNHLFFSNISENQINSVLKDNRYLEIVNHRNYNPRIIQSIIENEVYRNNAHEEFFVDFKRLLDYPENIWRHAFENQIGETARSVLLVLTTCGTPITLEELHLALISYMGQTNSDTNRFNKAVKELENSFTITFALNGVHIIDFQNNSIQDFLIKYISQESNLVVSLIDSFIYINQFLRISEKKWYKAILISNQALQLAVERIVNNFDNLKSSEISAYRYGRYVRRRDRSEIELLQSLIWRINIEKFPTLKKMIIERTDRIVNKESIIYSESKEVLLLMKKLNGLMRFDISKILQNYFDQLFFLEDLRTFAELKSLFEVEFDQWISSNMNKLNSIIYDIVGNESEQLKGGEIVKFIEWDIRELEILFSIDLEDLKLELESKVDYQLPEEEHNFYEDLEMIAEFEDVDELVIHQMFKSLK